MASTGDMISISQALGVVLRQVLLDLGDQVGVVGAALVQPEHGRVAGGAGAGDGELDPVAGSGRPWSGRRGRCRPRRPPARARRCRPASTTRTVPVAGISKVLSWLPYSSAFCAIRPTFGHRAHGGRVEGAVGAAVVDDGLVDAGVAAVREDGEGVGLLAVRAPHVAGGADHGRHRGVDDDVARHVQVGDALVGVDHRQRRALGQLGLEGRLDRRRPRAAPPGP